MLTLIHSGLYTVDDAARLLRATPRRVRGWVGGYNGSMVDPVILNEVGWLEGKLAFSFTNLMEIRFIQHFAALGIKVASIRAMAIEARSLLGHQHPFATKTVFRTDKRAIFAEVADKTNDRKLYDLKSKNWAMLHIIEQSLLGEVTYDPTGDAIAWKPLPDKAPNVILHPSLAFGQPVLDQEHVPTRAIFDAFAAEDESVERVAAWFEITTDRVNQAVRFETELKMAA